MSKEGLFVDLEENELVLSPNTELDESDEEWLKKHDPRNIQNQFLNEKGIDSKKNEIDKHGEISIDEILSQNATLPQNTVRVIQDEITGKMRIADKESEENLQRAKELGKTQINYILVEDEDITQEKNVYQFIVPKEMMPCNIPTICPVCLKETKHQETIILNFISPYDPSFKAAGIKRRTHTYIKIPYHVCPNHKEKKGFRAEAIDRSAYSSTESKHYIEFIFWNKTYAELFSKLNGFPISVKSELQFNKERRNEYIKYGIFVSCLIGFIVLALFLASIT